MLERSKQFFLGMATWRITSALFQSSSSIPSWDYDSSLCTSITIIHLPLDLLFLVVSSIESLLVVNPLSCFLCVCVFLSLCILFSFSEDHFNDILFHYPLDPIIVIKKLAASLIMFPLWVIYLFFLVAFKIFFLSFFVLQLHSMYPSVNFYLFVLFGI